jgi:hypothetical protein
LQHEVVATYNQFQAYDKSSSVAQFPEEHMIEDSINIIDSKVHCTSETGKMNFKIEKKEV